MTAIHPDAELLKEAQSYAKRFLTFLIKLQQDQM